MGQQLTGTCLFYRMACLVTSFNELEQRVGIVRHTFLCHEHGFLVTHKTTHIEDFNEAAVFRNDHFRNFLSIKASSVLSFVLNCRHCTRCYHIGQIVSTLDTLDTTELHNVE